MSTVGYSATSTGAEWFGTAPVIFAHGSSRSGASTGPNVSLSDDDSEQS